MSPDLVYRRSDEVDEIREHGAIRAARHSYMFEKETSKKAITRAPCSGAAFCRLHRNHLLVSPEILLAHPDASQA
ncbi:hypothetical protein CLCR_02694 [Cladophialophora carrionii]|uniref:Uncharacterized protein n=1 Tax=Cladophialophora carrionii TaxID=86049 RepID=A0A1C1CFQ9_9EURO|nr:hypothetical protein CLCR_02694 [Cladophialophora carrionii]